MAKVQIKSERLTPFGGIFSIMELFDSMLSPVIDSAPGRRCSSAIGYQYSEIVRSLISVYFCGGSCVEDVTSHLMRHLSNYPTLRTYSSDTILRAIRELTQDTISYTSNQGKTYDFNTADKLNTLLVNALLSAGELKEMEEYGVDFDHQFLETERHCRHFYIRANRCGSLYDDFFALRGGRRRKSTASGLSSTPFSSGNGRASATVSSSRGRDVQMATSTCGKANAPTAAS